MSTHFSPLVTCPHCGHKLNAATNAVRGQDGSPNPGDITMCIECERILVFKDDLTLRPANHQDLETIRGEGAGDDLDRARAQLQMVKRIWPK